MNDNGNIRLLTPENDMRVRAFLSSLEELSEKVEKIRESQSPGSVRPAPESVVLPCRMEFRDE